MLEILWETIGVGGSSASAERTAVEQVTNALPWNVGFESLEIWGWAADQVFMFLTKGDVSQNQDLREWVKLGHLFADSHHQQLIAVPSSHRGAPRVTLFGQHQYSHWKEIHVSQTVQRKGAIKGAGFYFPREDGDGGIQPQDQIRPRIRGPSKQQQPKIEKIKDREFAYKTEKSVRQ